MNQSVVVIVPVYKVLNRSEIQSIESLNKLESQSDLHICLVGSDFFVQLNNNQLSLVFSNFITLKNESFDEGYFKDVVSYNRLLLSNEFYQRFKSYEYMLIFQTDAFIIKDSLDVFIDKAYTYIGAPWLEANVPEKEGLSLGNGGFSLRHIPSFIKALKYNLTIADALWKFYYPANNWNRKLFKLFIYFPAQFLSKIQGRSFYFEKAKYNQMNEDVVWSQFIQDHKEFTLSSLEDALLFSFETMPRECYRLNNNQLPFGCHAPKKHDFMFWKSHIPSLNL
jgi:hypothetical protein